MTAEYSEFLFHLVEHADMLTAMSEPLFATPLVVLAVAGLLSMAVTGLALLWSRRVSNWHQVTPQYGVVYAAMCLTTFVLPRLVVDAGSADSLPSLSEIPEVLVTVGGPVAFQGAFAVYLFVETGVRSSLLALFVVTTGLLYTLLLTGGETTALVATPQLVGVGSVLILGVVALETGVRRLT